MERRCGSPLRRVPNRAEADGGVLTETNTPPDHSRPALIELESVVKAYGSGEVTIRALDEVSVSIAGGEFVVAVPEGDHGNVEDGRTRRQPDARSGFGGRNRSG